VALSSKIVGYDDIAGLRERERLLTYGYGRRRLFDDPDHILRLRLTDSTTFETGAVRLFLEPDHA
jgi:hypothetical protein